MKRAFFLLLLGLTCSFPLRAQRLLWEREGLHAGSTEDYNMAVVSSGTQLLVAGTTPFARPQTATCYASWQGFLQTWSLTGTLMHERLGRAATVGMVDLTLAVPGGRALFWWTGNQTQCANNIRHEEGVLIPVTTSLGDTLPGINLTPTLANHVPGIVLAHNNRVVIAGGAYPVPSGVNHQFQQFILTCSDTSGHILWQHNYPRLPIAYDFCSGLARLPNGGYLLTGDGEVTSGVEHLFTETDSMGNLRRQQLIYPLGPTFNSGNRVDENCNVVVLPHYGGYIVSGTADSAVGTAGTRHVAYLMKVDTALHKVWTYRIPTAWQGNLVYSQYAYRVRLLPDGTLALLLRNAGPFNPDTHLVQITQQGTFVQRYVLSSNGYYNISPLDWQLLNDGTLVMAGTAWRNATTTGTVAYLARWDMSRSGLLGTHSPAEVAAAATFSLSPNPSTGPVGLHWHLPPGQRAGQLRLYSVLGQLVRTIELPAIASGKLEVSGLAVGLYVARLVDAGGTMQGHAQRLEVRE